MNSGHAFGVSRLLWGPKGSARGSSSPVSRQLIGAGACRARPASGREHPGLQLAALHRPAGQPTGGRRAAARAVVGCGGDCGPRGPAAAGSLNGSHTAVSSHWAVEGRAPETALWGAGAERPSHPRVGVARQHVCPQCLAELGSEVHLYPEAIHPEVKKVTNNGMYV